MVKQLDIIDVIKFTNKALGNPAHMRQGAGETDEFLRNLRESVVFVAEGRTPGRHERGYRRWQLAQMKKAFKALDRDWHSSQ